MNVRYFKTHDYSIKLRPLASALTAMSAAELRDSAGVSNFPEQNSKCPSNTLQIQCIAYCFSL